jgi:hypothetical protein
MPESKHNYRLMMAVGHARLLREHWDSLPEDKRKEMALEAAWATDELMNVRNLVRTLADLQSPAGDVAEEYSRQ